MTSSSTGKPDFVSEVKRIGPRGLSAVFDGVGKDTFIPSLPLLRQLGRAVNYGNASGNVPPFNVMLLASKSLSVTRVGVTGHIQDTASFRSVAATLFELVRTGTIAVNIDRARHRRHDELRGGHRRAGSAQCGPWRSAARLESP
ncbi:zinc-binding dehydrogenase [Bradyrhizobium paxllaeri]|uniref:zinc-binding dehydrogenase n=1 Tax=Bradyrhizobium paxllaeri TaxID=190148 RepID=UPI00114660C2